MATVKIEDKELIAHNGKVITVPEALQKIGSKDQYQLLINHPDKNENKNKIKIKTTIKASAKTTQESRIKNAENAIQ